MIGSVINEVLFVLCSCCSGSKTLLLALFVLVDLLQLLGHQVNHVLGLLAGLLGVPLLLFPPARLLLKALQVDLFDRRLELLDLEQLLVLSLFELVLTLLVELQVTLGLFKHLAEVAESVLANSPHESKLEVSDLLGLLRWVGSDEVGGGVILSAQEVHESLRFFQARYRIVGVCYTAEFLVEDLLGLLVETDSQIESHS